VNLLSVLAVAERIIYFFVALTLIVPIVMLFVSVAMSMLQVSEAGILQTVLAILDRVLLVFIWSNCSTRSGSSGESMGSLLPNRFCGSGFSPSCGVSYCSPPKSRKQKAQENFKGCSPN
jgi:hypothetical protein